MRCGRAGVLAIVQPVRLSGSSPLLDPKDLLANLSHNSVAHHD